MQQKLDFKSDLFGNHHCFKFLEQSLIMSFFMLRYPFAYEGLPSSNSSNIAGTHIIFCGKQHGQALLLSTKSYACTCDIKRILTDLWISKPIPPEVGVWLEKITRFAEPSYFFQPDSTEGGIGFEIHKEVLYSFYPIPSFCLFLIPFRLIYRCLQIPFIIFASDVVMFLHVTGY